MKAIRLVAIVCLVTAAATAQQPAGSGSIVSTRTGHEEPTLKEFPRELVRNFGALFSTDNVTPLLIGGVATAGAAIPNKRLEGFFRDKPKFLFHEAGDFIGNAMVAGPSVGGLLLVSRTSDNARFRSFAYSVAQGFVVNQSLIGGIKLAVSSQRPDGRDNHSFPSGHTSGAFTWATIVNHHYGKRAGIPAYIAATYVGFSRLDDRAHRLTDVVAGAALGYLVGRTINRRSGFDPNRRFNWNVGVPPGGGAAFSLDINLGRRE